MSWWDSLIDAASDLSDTAVGIYNDWTSVDSSTANNTQTPAANDTGNTYPQTTTGGATSVPVWVWAGGGTLLVIILILLLRGGK
ncbi:MAG: hypothetical protein ACK5MF_04125 [Vibrio sp.]|uniref:hypothetical protein n=1 Tax=Vibrio sp. TaxID=678 RepID=UPI003A89B1B3